MPTGRWCFRSKASRASLAPTGEYGQLLERGLPAKPFSQTTQHPEQSVRCRTNKKQRISPLHNNKSEVKACLVIVVWCISALARSKCRKLTIQKCRTRSEERRVG